MTTTTVAATSTPASGLNHPIPTRSALRAALVSEWTKLRSVRSTVWALVLTSGFTIGLGALPASILFGLVWDRVGPQAAFTMGAALAISAAVGLVAMAPAPKTPAATPRSRA